MTQFYLIAQYFYFWNISPSANENTLLNNTELWNTKGPQETACVLHLFIVYIEIFVFEKQV